MELSSPDRQSIQELATPNKNLHIWICLFQLCKVCFGSWGGGNHYYDSTAPKAMQQLWSMESMTRHNRSHDHPLHPGLAPDVLTLSCLWIQLSQDERVRLTARLSPTIVQFTAHVILISNTHLQQAHIR